MDYLWTPWRYQYMAQAAGGQPPECIFCDAVAKKRDSETLIVHRGAKAFVILNRFPYTSGHVLIVRSEEHTSELQSRLHLVCRLLLEKKKKKERKIRCAV